MKLSKREKILLFALAMVAILAAGIYLFINPVNAMYFEATETLNDLELLEMEYRSAIAMVPSVQSSIDQFNAEIAAAEARLPEILHSGQVDETITRIALDFDLTPSNLKLNEQEVAVVAAFGEPEDLDIGPALPVYELSFNLLGDLNDMVSFLDSFAEHDYIRVTAFEITQQEEYYMLGADFTIYMR